MPALEIPPPASSCPNPIANRQSRDRHRGSRGDAENFARATAAHRELVGTEPVDREVFADRQHATGQGDGLAGEVVSEGDRAAARSIQIAWRSDPGPLSSTLVTTLLNKVRPSSGSRPGESASGPGVWPGLARCGNPLRPHPAIEE